MTAKHAIELVGLVGLALVLSACPFKATTKQITDTTSNITGTTSGKTWFEDGVVKRGEELQAFVELNFDNLKQDMAAGRGEYLATLGTLMGIAPSHHEEFFALAQARYAQLMRSDRTTPAEMLLALNEVLLPYKASLNPSSN